MKRGPGRPKKSEAIIKDVKRRTKRHFNPEEKIATVRSGGFGSVLGVIITFFLLGFSIYLLQDKIQFDPKS